ncbi:MAG: DUF1257 domain-containing protein [Candidatus Hadarchaeales archaeon]
MKLKLELKDVEALIATFKELFPDCEVLEVSNLFEAEELQKKCGLLIQGWDTRTVGFIRVSRETVEKFCRKRVYGDIGVRIEGGEMVLVYDNYTPEDIVRKIKENYAIRVVRKIAARKGYFEVAREKLPDGTIKIVLEARG